MPSADPNIATCPSCGTLIDVSEQEPFALVNCSICGAQMRVQQEFANFELQAMLGEGGQGRVFRAVDKRLNRPVAIKVMKREYSADPDFVRRFESEARITASLNNPHIVKVYSCGEYRGLVYLAMEVVDHGSLDSLMAGSKKVPEEQVIDIGIQIAVGLKAGLELGLIHRDIKPGNILFADERTAKIVDFGLAILVEKQAEEQGEVWATPYYVSPEKLDGQPEDFRSDMYSLAATLFHALAGRPPFISESNSMAELRRIKSAPVRLLNFASHVSTPTAYAIDRALSFKPGDRFASYDEFIQRLEYARAELRKKPVKTNRPRVKRMGDPANGGSWVTFATVALVVGTGVYLWVNRDRGNGGNGDTELAAPGLARPDVTAEVSFDEGRKQLVEGRFPEAAKNFRALYVDARLPEPKNSWAGVHHGLAEYFAERPGPARTALKSLPERVTPTAIGVDAKLVAFLNRLAVISATKSKDTAAEMAGLDATSYESLAYLFAGLKQWNLGNFDEGVVFFRQFQQAAPAGDSAWVADYRPLVVPYLEDHGNYREIVEGLAKVNSDPEAGEAALKKIAENKDRVRSRALRKRLEELEAESADKIKAAVASAKDAGMKMQAEAAAQEEKLLTDAKLQVKDLCENYRFTDAAALIRGVNVKLEKSVGERDLLAKRVNWLVEFKQQLINDLNASGCSIPLLKKNGQKLLGTVARADEHQFEVRVQFGTLPGIKWNEISPQSVLQMSRFYMKPALPPALLADREWRAGVFCLFTQLSNEGQALMEEAAAQKPEYQNDRALFFGQAAPSPAPDSAPAPADGPAPGGTGLEMADQPLNPSRKDANSPLTGGLRPPVPQ